MTNLWRSFFLWISGTWAYLFCLKWVIPAFRFWGRSLPQFVVDRALKQVRVGDILLLKDRYKLSNLLIGGSYSHAGMYVGQGMVAEMSSYNFSLISMKNFVAHSTKLAAFRLQPYDRKYSYKMARKARSFRDAVYDFRFSMGIEVLYCSEMIYHADSEHRMQADLSDLAGLGQNYLSPDGIASAKGLREVFFYEI